MKSEEQRKRGEERLVSQFKEMYEELYAWREAHPEASFDEIANQVTPRRQKVMGELLNELVLQHGSGEVVEGLRCEQCGQPLVYKGKPERGVEHLEGEARFKRAYYYCAHCESGLFPPGRAVEVGEARLESGDDSAGGGVGDSNCVVSARGAQFSGADQSADVQE